jgi:hypothetical protein
VDDQRAGHGCCLELGGPGPDQRVHDVLETASGVPVGEDPGPECGPVEPAVLGQHPRAERLDDGRETRCPRLDDLAGQLVRVDHQRP